MAFENIAKSLYVAGQLPLDRKTWFPTLTELKSLGVANSKAFTYYEYMKVMVAETGEEFVWKEVDQSYTGGALDQNFLYPANVLSDGIDYSNRYFNFVPANITLNSVIPGLLVFKSPENNINNLYLEPKDVVAGFFGVNDFRWMRYVGGPVSVTTSWADIDGFQPNSFLPNS